ncbi:MAG: quinone oxidoreductase family protein [Quisquiliibacterium sp.]
MTTKMKAAIRGEHGLELVQIDTPRPGAEEVLVRVQAFSLNRADLGVLAGHMHGNIGGPGTVLGMEFAGEVVEVGAAVTGIAPGDRVMCSGKAAFAQYAVADMGRTIKLPNESMTFEQATTLPVALQTMHDALITNGRLKKGESVLIQGASSGVGLMALQIARLMGAGTVMGTSTNAARRARLTEFGADLALDSNDPDWVRQALEATGDKGVDLTIDQLSGAVMNQSMAAAAVLGRIVNVGRLAGTRAEFDFDLHALKRIDYIGVTFRTRSVQEVREITRKMTADLAPHFASGKLALPIDKVFPFEQVGAAFDHMRENKHFGKLVVTMG